MLYISNSDNPLNLRRSLCKTPEGHILIWFHTQMEDGANVSSLWSSQQNRCSHTQQKHKSKSMLTRQRHRLLWHCHRSSAKGYISPIPVHNLPRLCTSNVSRFNERKWPHTGKGKKQMIPHSNYHGRGLRWWHCASRNYPA